MEKFLPVVILCLVIVAVRELEQYLKDVRRK